MEPEETVVTRQQLRKLVPAAANIHGTTEEQFDEVFSMRSVSYEILNMQRQKGMPLGWLLCCEV
jgi:hypothetical protein